MYTLRNYQNNIVALSRQAIRDGYKSIMVVSPTGSGKTVIFAYIAYMASLKEKRVLILTHREEIFSQTLEKLAAYGIYAGKISSGSRRTLRDIQVGMIQTVANRLDRIEKQDLIIIDEGHHVVAKTWSKVLQHFSNVPKLLFTATSIRTDGSGFSDLCDYMIKGNDVIQLVADGWLTVSLLKTPAKEHLFKFHKTAGDYDKKEQLERLTQKAVIGDVIGLHQEFLRHKPTLSFVSSIAHGKVMEKIYLDAGIKAKLIQGGTKHKAERRWGCSALGDGTIEILISCDVVSEGFDVPNACGCHMLRRTASTGLYLQQLGRIFRPIYATGYNMDTVSGRLAAIATGPKPVAYGLDFVGNYYDHGHPLDYREWSLEGEKKKPKEKAAIKKCPRCLMPNPIHARICIDPDCRYDFEAHACRERQTEIKHIEGELIDALPAIDYSVISKIAGAIAFGNLQEKRKAIMRAAFNIARVNGNKTDLETLAKLAGYKTGWSNWAWKYTKDKIQSGKSGSK